MTRTKKKAKERVLFEYVISEPTIFDMNKLLLIESGSYTSMVSFHTKHEMLLVFVVDGQKVISFDPNKNKIRITEMPYGGIKSIERWSAFIQV
jgi:hypothetical protein